MKLTPPGPKILDLDCSYASVFIRGSLLVLLEHTWDDKFVSAKKWGWARSPDIPAAMLTVCTLLQFVSPLRILRTV